MIIIGGTLSGCDGGIATLPSPATRVGAIGTPTPHSVTGQAPSFAEIQQMVDHITKTSDHPGGAPVGPDGITDPVVVREMTALNDSLYGKRATAWRGWFRGSTRHDEDGYSIVSIQMTSPPVKHGCCSDVTLAVHDVDQRALAQRLGVGRQIVFSGTIGTIDLGGGVELLDPKLAPLK